jgi:hypothetical protein
MKGILAWPGRKGQATKCLPVNFLVCNHLNAGKFLRMWPMKGTTGALGEGGELSVHGNAAGAIFKSGDGGGIHVQELRVWFVEG